jgi:hypothetical protein
MIRSTMAVLAFVIWSGFALAPGSIQAQEARTHEVVRGETLWSIAQAYFGDGHQWSRIFEANRDRMSDPHALEVGLVLTIPSEEGPEVGEVTVMAPEEPPAEGMEQEPMAPPQEMRPRPRRRTAFFPDTANPTLIAETGPELTAVPSDVVYSAPWLVPLGTRPEHQGRIVDFAGAEGDASARESARPHDLLLVHHHDPKPPVGSLIQTFRVDHDVEDVGSIIQPTGVLRVQRVESAGVVAEVVKLYARMVVGDFVGTMPAYDLTAGERAQPVSDGSEATIVGFANPRPVYSLGDVVFIDKGAADGVGVGDTYAASVSATEGWSGEVEGEIQVIGIHADHASARITMEKTPVFQRGLLLRLTRKMR